MSIPDAQQKIEEILENYVVAAREELAKRWDARDIARLPMETYEVLGALLARQVTLATQMARNPGIWNWHMIPHILRSMADVHITMAWILMDPVDRSKKFIAYGLGQQKLILEHIKSKFKDESAADEKKKAVELIEAWIDSQKFSFLTDVNVGNWAGKDTRSMADDVGLSDLYRFTYLPFSGAVHSQWHHIGQYNVTQCTNPLHALHFIPQDRDFPTDMDGLLKTTRCLEDTFRLFDEKTENKAQPPSAREFLLDGLSVVGNSLKPDKESPSPS